MQYDLPSRRKKDRPEQISMRFTTKNGSVEDRLVKREELPRLPFAMPILRPPSILYNRPAPPVGAPVSLDLVFFGPQAEDGAYHKLNQIASRNEADKIEFKARFSYNAFARLLAKISYSQEIAEFGFSFDSFLPDYILGKHHELLPHVIGGAPNRLAVTEENARHWWLTQYAIYHCGPKMFFTAQIELFRFLKNHPSYWVVICEADERLSQLVMGTHRSPPDPASEF